MDNIIDDLINNNHAKSTYKKPAMHLFIVSFILNVLMFYFALQYINQTQDVYWLEKILGLHSILGFIVMVIGITLTYLSFKTKEDRTYQYAVSAWGFSILLISFISSIILL